MKIERVPVIIKRCFGRCTYGFG